MEDILKNVLTEMNILNLTNNPSPILSPLSKEVSKQNIGPKQSDILKVININIINVNVLTNTHRHWTVNF